MPGFGPATTTVRLQGRGGAKPWRPVPYSDLTWGRTEGSTSTAQVTVPLGSDRAAALARAVNPLEHELSVWRTVAGQAPEEVWVGPVVDVPTRSRTELRVEASDLSWWLSGRPVLENVRSWQVDPVFIARDYVVAAMRPEPSPGLVVHAEPTGRLTSRSVRANQWRYASDLIEELADNELDWTVVGRVMTVRGGPPEVPAFELRSSWVAADNIPRLGGQGTQVVVLPGSPDPDEGWSVAGVAGGVDARRGLYVVVLPVRELPLPDPEEGVTVQESQNAADDAARANLPAVVGAPGAVSCTILDRAPFPMSCLVPGVRMRTRLGDHPALVGDRAALADYQLTDVTARVTPGSEQVTVDGPLIGELAG